MQSFTTNTSPLSLNQTHLIYPKNFSIIIAQQKSAGWKFWTCTFRRKSYSYYELNMASNNKSGNCWVLKERFKNERGRGFDELEQQSNGLYEDHHHRSHRRRVNGTSCWPPMFDLKCLTSNSTFFLTPWRHALPFNYLTEAEDWGCPGAEARGRAGTAFRAAVVVRLEVSTRC